MDLSEVRSATATRHPWETARTDAIERILRQRDVRPRSILDVGCGDGYAGQELTRRLGADSFCGIDLHLSEADCAAMSGPGARYERTLSAIEGNRFDLALLCDVIEHVEDDRALVRQAMSQLDAHGYLLVTVPSFQALFSSHDVALRHYRRYSLTQVEGVIRAAGAEVVDGGYLFASLLPVRAVTKALETIRKPPSAPENFGVGGWDAPELVTKGLSLALGAENALLLKLASWRLKVPGLSSWVLCRNRS